MWFLLLPALMLCFQHSGILYFGSELTPQREVCFQTFVNYTPFSRSKSAHVLPGLWQYVYPAEANDGSHGHTVTNLVFLLHILQAICKVPLTRGMKLFFKGSNWSSQVRWALNSYIDSSEGAQIGFDPGFRAQCKSCGSLPTHSQQSYWIICP